MKKMNEDEEFEFIEKKYLTDSLGCTPERFIEKKSDGDFVRLGYARLAIRRTKSYEKYKYQEEQKEIEKQAIKKAIKDYATNEVAFKTNTEYQKELEAVRQETTKEIDEYLVKYRKSLKGIISDKSYNQLKAFQFAYQNHFLEVKKK